MRKNYNFIRSKFAMMLSVVALFTTLSCSKSAEAIDDIVYVPVSITSTSSLLEFDAAENLSQTITITASDAWVLLNDSDDSIYGYADWVSSVSPEKASGDSEVKITVDESNSVESRDTKLYFGIKDSYGEYQLLVVELQQSGIKALFSISAATWFSGESADEADYTQELTISTNSEWRVFTAEDDEAYAYDDWVTIDTFSGEGDATVSITVTPFTEDTDEYSRSATIYIGADVEGEEPVELTVNQFAKNTHHISSPELEAVGDIIYIDQEGTACEEFELITSYPWVIPDADDSGLNGHYSWVTPSQMSGVCSDKLSISCSANTASASRESYLWIGLTSADGVTTQYKKYQIIQTGTGAPELSADDSKWFMSESSDSSNYTQSVNVYYPEAWRLYTVEDGSGYAYDDWVTVNTTSGEGDGTVSVTVTPCTDSSIYERKTVIYIGAADGSVAPVGIWICQFGALDYHISSPELTPLGDVIDIDNAGTESDEFQLITSHAWSIPYTDGNGSNGCATWITPSQLEGVCNDKITFSCSPNNSIEARESYIWIVLHPTDGTPVSYQKFKLVQAGLDASFSLSSVTDNTITLGSSKLSQSFKVTSSADWEIRYDSPHVNSSDWFSVTPTSGSTGDVITIQVEANSSTTESRSTEVYFTMDDTYADMEPMVYTITQNSTGVENATFELSSSSISFIASSSTAQMVSLTLDSDFAWRIMSSDVDSVDYDCDYQAWATPSATSGVAGSDIIFQIKASTNQFNTARSTTMYLIQEESNKVISLRIDQELNIDSEIGDYGCLGYGYDSSGLYANQSALRSKVLDCDKLEALGLLAEVNYVREGTMTQLIAESASSLQTALTTSAKITGAYSGFSAEVSTNYGSTYQNYEETMYGSQAYTYEYAQIFTTNYPLVATTQADWLRSCVIDSVLEQINSGDAATVIKTYGSHVILGYILGGKFEYFSSAICSSSVTKDDFGLSVSSGYKDGVNNIGASADASYSTEEMQSYFASEEYYTTRGGGLSSDSSGETALETWKSTMTKGSDTVLVDFFGEGAYPIWLLADTEDQQKLLYNAAIAATEDISDATAKGLYQFQFWLGEIGYRGDDSGGTAEFNVYMNRKYVPAKGVDHSNYIWTDMWSTQLSDMIYSGNDATYTTMNIIPIGTDSESGLSVSTNKYTTEEMFIGGGSQVEIAIYLYLDEDDGGLGVDDITGFYHYFRSRPYYSRDGSDPFYYVGSTALSNYPFSEVDYSGGSYTTANKEWNDNLTPVTTGSSTYRNGYVWTESSDGKWCWTLNYRDINNY